MPHFGPSRLFGIAAPIIQAPMAGVSTPQLAAAVSNAGGLGSLGIGASPMPAAQRMIEETRARTSRPFNGNVVCHRAAQRDAAAEATWLAHLTPFFKEFGGALPVELREIYTSFGDDEDMFRMLLASWPPIISFHFGLPGAERLAAFRDAGIRMLQLSPKAAATSRRKWAGQGASLARERPAAKLVEELIGEM